MQGHPQVGGVIIERPHVAELAGWLFEEMGSSYLRDIKAHFEVNKRSKEYTAHQSKVGSK